MSTIIPAEFGRYYSVSAYCAKASEEVICGIDISKNIVRVYLNPIIAIRIMGKNEISSDEPRLEYITLTSGLCDFIWDNHRDLAYVDDSYTVELQPGTKWSDAYCPPNVIDLIKKAIKPAA